MLPATQSEVARGSAARLEHCCVHRLSSVETNQLLLTKSSWQTWTVQPCRANRIAATAPTGPPPAMTAVLLDILETNPGL